ncbi:hypothetical protein Ocin01_10070 [Orchesella cincta]|uniref:Uncharacterized protein n=1 Tax=Orchesella cincta TaxID=48709 RepID=A0A1D2MU38_ORCCI|nr:hypothetical protein Ocin01_10070 [Orchesella cincta]
MAVPAVVVLGVVLWILFSAFKYWYISRTKINYTHKLDEKILEDIRTPSQCAFDKAARRKREQVFVDEPEGYPFKATNNTERGAGQNDNSKDDDGDKPHTETAKKRPLTIFEEIDLLQKQGKVKPKTCKYDRSMFEDSLSRLYRDLQHERKKSSEDKENKSDK